MPDLKPKAICQRVACESPSVCSPVFTIWVEGDKKTVRSTLAFCEACRVYALEAILPEIAAKEAVFPFLLVGLKVDQSKTAWALERFNS